MIRRVFALIAAAITAACLMALTKPAQASTQSAAPLAAVRHCSQVTAATRHRGGGQRSLSSAKLVKAKRLCAEVHTHVGTIRYWNKSTRSWTLYKHYQHYTCWALKRRHMLEGPEGLCMVARGAVRTSAERIVKLDQQIKTFLPKPQPKLKHDWLFNALVCIHGGEGAWNSVSKPYYYQGHWIVYYGGLQMDLSFQSRYGAAYMARWGTANNWPAWAQLKAAARAYRSGRGFYPWPSTARACGLI